MNIESNEPLISKLKKNIRNEKIECLRVSKEMLKKQTNDRALGKINVLLYYMHVYVYKE